MNTDIRLSVDFLQNIKVRKLKKMLGADGVLALIALWTYCAKNHPNGELGKFSPDVELIAEWDGEEGAFVEALKSLRFLDENEDGSLALHDWEENNPYTAYSQERSDAGRLAKLKQDNPKAAKYYMDQGRTGITKEEYNKAKYGVLEGEARRDDKLSQSDPAGDPQGTPEGEPRDTLCTNTNTNTYTNTNIKTVEALRACARGGGDQELLLTDFTPEETEIVRLFTGVNGLKFDAQKLVQQTRDLRGEYPNVNILSEAKKMALWLDGADGKKKSGKRNLLLFVRNWVERANNTPSPPLRELERKRNGSMSLRNADGTFGDLTPEEEAEQRALEERYSNLDEEGNRIT